MQYKKKTTKFFKKSRKLRNKGELMFHNFQTYFFSAFFKYDKSFLFYEIESELKLNSFLILY